MDNHKMDDKRLDDIFKMDVPAPDDNARKVALNLALSEFEAAKKESANSSQGNPLLTRLISKPGQNRRKPMKNMKLVYGGMATAMVLVLAVGVSIPQTQNFFTQGVAPETGSVLPVTGQHAQSAGASGNNNFSTIAQNVVAGMAEQKLSAPAPMQNKERADAAVANTASVAAPPPAEATVAGGAPPQAEMAMDMAAQAPMPTAAPAHAFAAKRAMAPMMAGAAGGVSADMAYATTAYMPEPMPSPYYQEQGRDKFEHTADNPVKAVSSDPVSTFSIDVDTSSYSFVRRLLNQGQMPPKDSVRVEEMVNYFDYHYALPQSKEQPFQSTVTVTPSPWKADHKLVHIGIKGYDVVQSTRPHSNLVFLIDTSGSMNEPTKLPLLITSLKMLLQTLKPDDTVGIVTYAGNAGVALEPTKVSESSKIINALDSLSAGGGTAGAEGLRTAYQLAQNNLDKNGVNRVLLATDGDFNIGISDPKEMKAFIEQKRKTGIFLSVLGFGEGNYNDAMMQQLAQNGNGTAAYIDNLNEARKVLVQEASSTLFTIAKDVKLQVEFNPATVAEYRLVGYETRALNREDFNNDTVDAGDIGSGHAVTAIYDITPVGAAKAIDDSRYAAKPAETHKADSNFGDEYAYLKIRYKLPNEDTSKLITTPITGKDEKPLASTSEDVRFSVAVAGFAQLLKGSQYTGTLSYDDVITAAQGAKGADEFGYRSEFIQMVRMAKTASGLSTPEPQPVPMPEPVPPVMHPMDGGVR